MGKKTDFTKPTTIAILLFCALTAWLVFNEDAEAATTIELQPGASFVAGHRYSGYGVLLSERFANKYDLGVMLFTDQECVGPCRRGSYGPNGGIQAQRVFNRSWFELGVGGAYWNRQTPAWNSNYTFSLYIGLDLRDRGHWLLPDYVRWRHWSTGGSSDRNGGLDVLMIGWGT